jgi:hypothetical protein
MNETLAQRAKRLSEYGKRITTTLAECLYCDGRLIGVLFKDRRSYYSIPVSSNTVVHIHSNRDLTIESLLTQAGVELVPPE